MAIVVGVAVAVTVVVPHLKEMLATVVHATFDVVAAAGRAVVCIFNDASGAAGDINLPVFNIQQAIIIVVVCICCCCSCWCC